MSLLGPLCILLSSLAGIPLAYLVSRLSFMDNPLFLLMFAVSFLCLAYLVPYLVLRNQPQRIDSFFYVLGILGISAVGNLMIALENDGLITGFMSRYVLEGEPYLQTNYSTVTSYWDGVVHSAMYFVIVFAQGWNLSYRGIGVYWAASFGHSVLVYTPAIFSGPYDIRWPCLITIPYVIIPFYFGTKFVCQNRPDKETVVSHNSQPTATSIWKRPVDGFFVLFFLAAGVLAVFRFSAAMGGNNHLAQYYLHNIEPYLDDASVFPRAQMMVYLFNFLPYYAAAVYGLLWPGHSWMLDWSLLHAGAAAEAQTVYIGASLRSPSPLSNQGPATGCAHCLFWLINGSMLIVPQLLAYRCINFPMFFAQTVKPGESHAISEKVETEEKKKA